METALAKSSGNLWWWDNYIDPQDLYNVFTPLSVYLEDEDLAGLQQAASIINGTQPMLRYPAFLIFGVFPRKQNSGGMAKHSPG